MRRLLKISLAVSLALNSSFIIAARYRLSYDAYVHMFFADHYRQSWWSLWEPRWYLGFSVVSYPPLVHQVMGLIARLVGVEIAFVVVLLTIVTTLPLAIYSFARIFYGARVASYAAIAASIAPSLYLTAYTFGQLPTLAGLWFALFGLAVLAGYLRSGRLIDLGLTIGLMAVTAAAHHGTLLFIPWGGGAVVLHVFLNEHLNWKILLRRLLTWCTASGASVLVVIWPFWQWWMGQSMQTPIDHLSRHNYLLDTGALTMFFWPVYGPLLVVLAWTVLAGLSQSKNNKKTVRVHLGLVALVLVLFILGLGGTTPLPRLLFGAQWEWLTYDRFALWASIALLPIAGEIVVWWRRWSGKRLPAARGWVIGGVLLLTSLFAVRSALMASILPIQPEQVDIQPLADYLARGRRAEWRYLTFGFGDQITRLSLLTTATTLDGSYHTARELPILRNSGIGQIDTIYWMANGLKSLDTILNQASADGVRWGFVNLPAYRYPLAQHGWVWRQTLSNGVEVWENPTAIRAALTSTINPGTLPARISWGILPITALVITSILALAKYWMSGIPNTANEIPAIRVVLNRVAASLLTASRVAVGLLPMTLGFWYYRVLSQASHPGVYFTYDNALLFLSDVVVTAAIVLGLMGYLFKRLAENQSIAKKKLLIRRVTGITVEHIFSGILVGLVILSLASVSWSIFKPISIYIALHLALMLGLYLVLRNDPKSWRFVALGSCAVLLVESGIALIEYTSQSTAFLAPLALSWPGIVTPAVQGTSVIDLANGTRLLRAYGTLPHPNLLGGMLVGWMVGPLGLLYALPQDRSNVIWRFTLLGLLGLGTLAIGLSFSRSAWIGYMAGGAILLITGRRLNKLITISAAAICTASLAFIAVSQAAALSPRVGNVQTPAEARSTLERSVLVKESLALITKKPLTGTGIGTFALAPIPGRAGAPISEPVHNLPLLAASELGVAGGLLTLALGLAALWEIRKAKRPTALVYSGALLALFCIGLFDHYLWSQAPGRELLWVTMGVWAGQIRAEK